MFSSRMFSTGVRWDRAGLARTRAPPLHEDTERAKGLKLPLEVYVLIPPVLFAVTALFTTLYHALRHDPEMSNASFYERPGEEVAAQAQRYHHNPIQRFFEQRAHEHRRMSLFDNDFSKATH